MSIAPSSKSQLPVFRIAGFSGHRQIENGERLTAAIGAAIDRLRSVTADEWIALSSVAHAKTPISTVGSKPSMGRIC
jgi:hypothetical protein